MKKKTIKKNTKKLSKLTRVNQLNPWFELLDYNNLIKSK
jgi:hypothetical protein